MIPVIINGANGRMGQTTVKAINADPELQLVASCSVNDDLSDAIQSTQAKIVIDFTGPDSVFENAQLIIRNKTHPVIGTTGLLPDQISQLTQQCQKQQLGGIIAPNFSIGAILMMKYAQDAARYFSEVEIIEMHHDGKLDSPSGTALKTADMIAKNRLDPHPIKKSKQTIPGARGANEQNIAIHAVRLPGFVASQEVIFGGVGETFKIRHDSINRECFMPGVLLACKKVSELKTLIYGLENLL